MNHLILRHTLSNRIAALLVPIGLFFLVPHLARTDSMRTALYLFAALHVISAIAMLLHRYEFSGNTVMVWQLFRRRELTLHSPLRVFVHHLGGITITNIDVPMKPLRIPAALARGKADQLQAYLRAQALEAHVELESQQ